MIHSGADIKEALPHFSPDTSVLKLLVEALQANGDKVAQVEGQTGKSARSLDILQHSTSIAAGLHGAGVTTGDYVVILSDKSILAFKVLLGTMIAGATAVMVHPQGAGEIQRYTRNHPIKAVFSAPVYAEAANKSVSSMSPKPLLVATIDPEDKIVASLLNYPRDDFSFYDVKDVNTHIPLILFTSGSTGDSKGVPLSDLCLQRFRDAFDFESVDSYLVTGLFGWLSTMILLVGSIIRGFFLVLSDSKDAGENLQLIQKYKINGWFMGSSLANLYIKEPTLSQFDLSSLRAIMCAGDVLLRRVREEFIVKVLKGRLGVQQVYGMSELGTLTTWKNKNTLDPSKADSSGCVAPGVQVKVVDDADNVVGPGRVGELLVKSVGMMAGYWGRPELNPQLFDKDGFLRTGDSGYCDQDGFLYVTGRVKDLINIGGLKVSVSDSEDILKSHPAVIDVAIVATVSSSNIPQIAAFVVKKQGFSVIEKDLLSFLEEQTGKPTKISEVCFLNGLPKTATGKVQRKILQEMLLKS